jgi:hypothetical protein
MQAFCVAAVSALSVLPACDDGSRDGGASSAKVVNPHDEHDCSVAHPEPRPPIATITALRPEDRGKLTSLRITAHRGNVAIRKETDGWLLSGSDGCNVNSARMERALENLTKLTGASSEERPASSDFELQIAALNGQERVLHLDVAGRKDGKDLVQLADGSTYRVSGLDRDLLSPHPHVWCQFTP